MATSGIRDLVKKLCIWDGKIESLDQIVVLQDNYVKLRHELSLIKGFIRNLGTLKDINILSDVCKKIRANLKKYYFSLDEFHQYLFQPKLSF